MKAFNVNEALEFLNHQVVDNLLVPFFIQEGLVVWAMETWIFLSLKLGSTCGGYIGYNLGLILCWFHVFFCSIICSFFVLKYSMCKIWIVGRDLGRQVWFLVSIICVYLLGMLFGFWFSILILVHFFICLIFLYY